jgi:hypothetical protein
VIFPGANFLLQGQNYHLIPSIPYYGYGASFEEMRPILECKGVRIEGLWPRGEPKLAQGTG